MSTTPLVDRTARRLRHRGVTDAVIAAALGVIVALATVPASTDQVAEDGKTLNAGTFVLIGLCAAALALRRRWPLVSLAATLVLLWVYLALGYAYGPIFLLPFVAVFSYAVIRPLADAVVVLAIANIANVVMFTVVLPGDDDHGLLWTTVMLMTWLGLPLFVGWAWREVARARARTQAAEHRRHRADERVVMAREIHDVVGHSLAVVSMNAGVALHLLEKRPEAAAELTVHLRAIRDTSSRALDDLRATLAPLRAGQAAELRPAFGLDDIDDLIADVRGGGLDVAYTRTGERGAVQAAVAATVYRVVQESLTNVIRHAGATRAAVVLDCRAGRLAVHVTDDGRAQPAPSAGGHGISGMTERVEAHGGTLRSGPEPGGGFGVHAAIPYVRSAD